MVTTRSMARRRAELAAVEKVAESGDLVFEILLRLPTKSLLKFKLVSTQWISLISDPYFVRSHTRFIQNTRSLKPEALLFDAIHKNLPTEFKSLRLNSDGKQLPELDFVDYPCVWIIQACNGLFLCVTKTNNVFENSFNTLTYFICNPFLKKSKTISFPIHPRFSATPSTHDAYRLDVSPSETRIVKDYVHVGLSMAFDPVQSPYYKILSFWRQTCTAKHPQRDTWYKLYKYSVDVYSSESNTWSIKKFEFISTQGLFIDGAIYLNGAIHWDSFDRELTTMI